MFLLKAFGFVARLLWRFLQVFLISVGLFVTLGIAAIGWLAWDWLEDRPQLDLEQMALMHREAPPSRVERDSVLLLQLSGVLIERRDERERFRQQLATLTEDRSFVFNTPAHDLVAALDRAAADERIDGAVLDLSAFQFGYPALLDEVAAALLRFRDSGKRVLAIGEYMTQSGYYLAAHADTLLLDPMGAVDISGFGVYALFLAEALEHLKLSVHAFVGGDYKSAPEVFTANAMSENSQAAGRRWTGELWAAWKQRVEQQTGIRSGAIQDYANFPDQHLRRAGGDVAQAALDAGLVHATFELAGLEPQHYPHLFYRTAREFWNEGRQVGADDRLPWIHWHHYLELSGGPAGSGRDGPFRPTVAVVFAEGAVSAYDDEDNFDAWRVAQDIYALNDRDDKPAAIVLRIHSPGGSVFAAEIVRRAVARSEIPVLASIGGMGASGGYYIASAADRIWASPGSITGSIGVFALLFTAEQAVDWLGMNYDGVGTSDLTGSRTPFTSLHPRLKAAIDASVEHQYRAFKDLVGAARNLAPGATEAIAGGQVWTGQEAYERGLLDGLGNLEQAAEAAAALAGVGKYQLEFIAAEENFLADFLRTLPWLRSQLAELISWRAALPAPAGQLLQTWLRYPDPQGLYMSCLECNLLATPLRAAAAPVWPEAR